MKRFFLLLALGYLTIDAHALSVWDGVSASTDWYTQGSGAVYHIKTAADLAGLSKCFSEGYYLHGNFEGRTVYLDDDIDLAGYEWTPIGTLDAYNYYYAFAGTFDGQGHSIKGLKITKATQNPYIQFAGLFGYSPTGSFSVRNLNIEGTIKLSNTSEQSYSALYVGGIVGSAEIGSAIENCQSKIDIEVVQNVGGEINVYCGAIAGSVSLSNNSDAFTECSSNGTIHVELNNANRAYVGGISANVSAPSSGIDQCASDINMVVENGDMTCVGGIVGSLNSKSISNTLFSGSILLQYPSYGLAGGIACMNHGANTYDNCLVIGSISKYYGTGWMSAISGTSGSGVSINNCYYLSSLPNSTSYGFPLSETELKSGEPIDGFDTDIWVFSAGSYPYLGFTKPTYLLNLALEGGYVGIRLNEGISQKLFLSQEANSELYQVLWNEEDITDLVGNNGELITPEIYDNSILRVVYRSSGVAENRIEEKTTTFKIYGSSLILSNPNGIQDLQIFSKSGVMIRNISNVGTDVTIDDLDHNVYIIKVNSETFKIII